MPVYMPVSSAQIIPFPERPSFKKRADFRSGQAFDVDRFYADFPDRWQAFLHGAFDSANDVAHHCRISDRAADKWWQGIGGPRGDKLAFCLVTVPGADAALLKVA